MPRIKCDGLEVKILKRELEKHTPEEIYKQAKKEFAQRKAKLARKVKI